MGVGPFHAPSGLTYYLRIGGSCDAAPLLILTREFTGWNEWEPALGGLTERDVIIAEVRPLGATSARPVTQLITEVSEPPVVLLDGSGDGVLGRSVAALAPRTIAGLLIISVVRTAHAPTVERGLTESGDSTDVLATLIAEQSDDLAQLLSAFDRCRYEQSDVIPFQPRRTSCPGPVQVGRPAAIEVGKE